MKQICVVTATRAEYGLLRRIIAEIEQDDFLTLQLVVTGTHLCRSFGYTVSEIEEDGFPIAARIPIMQDTGEKESMTDIMAEAMRRFGRFFEHSATDMLVLLGDRYELIPIAMAAVTHNIPIAHLNGGEITEGAIDDVVRHCVTKMSWLHFTACDTYRNRVIQLGEAPERVFNYGDTGVENIEKMELVSKKELSEILGISFKKPCASVTFHPVTRESGTALSQVRELLEVLSDLPGMDFIITMANADEGGKEINEQLKEYAAQFSNLRLFASLGVRNYISLLHYADMIIGNSSSGIIEAPSAGIPTVDIGDRQKGRLCSRSVIHCQPQKADIRLAIQKAAGIEMKNIARAKQNPYAGGNTSQRIVQTIREILQQDKIAKMKPFYDLPFLCFDVIQEGKRDE